MHRPSLTYACKIATCDSSEGEFSIHIKFVHNRVWAQKALTCATHDESPFPTMGTNHRGLRAQP
eukprot:6547031-Prymnesium_polylepis.1